MLLADALRDGMIVCVGMYVWGMEVGMGMELLSQNGLSHAFRMALRSTLFALTDVRY